MKKFFNKHWFGLAVVFVIVAIIYFIYKEITGAISSAESVITSPFTGAANAIGAAWNNFKNSVSGFFPGSNIPQVVNDPNSPIQTDAQAEAFLLTNPQYNSDFNNTTGGFSFLNPP